MSEEIIGALPIGTILKSAKRTYRIEKVLGSGGFGITYKVSAEIYVDNVPVTSYFAIKEHFEKKICERRDNNVISSPSNSLDLKESLDNFISEAKRLNKLSASHNNIVKVNEYFVANDTAYYVMEYIDGESIRDILKSRGNKPFSWDEAIQIITPVAEALSYLHENRLTHLDIKPDNILLDSRKNNRPVLIDFGLAKHYDRKGDITSKLLNPGYTHGFSPVEQYVGITKFSPKADVYSLAATLLFMLTGKDPDVAIEMNDTKVRDALRNKAPEYAIEAMVKALKKSQDERTSSVKEFLEGLTSDYKRSARHIPDQKKISVRNADTVNLELNVTPKRNLYKIIIPIASTIVLAALAIGGIYLFSNERYEKLPDGSKFYGELNAGGKPDGEGRLVTLSGYEFTGVWHSGDFETGVLKTSEFEYDGDFKNMTPSGYGTAKYSDGRIYIGNWENGQWNGLGRNISSDGKISFGIFKNGELTNPQPFTIGDKVYGIDVSKWQRQIDWNNLFLPANAEGTVSPEGGNYMQPAFYAIIKATDGKDPDDFYDRNYLNAKKCGIVCGAYHFLSMKTAIDDQVEAFIRTSNLTEGDLPPVLDLELPHDIMKERRKEVCENAIMWLKKIESHYGVKPIIYTYYSFIKDYLTDPRFDDYQFFIAYHRSELPYVKNWVLWQFSEETRIPAIQDNSVDIDIFNGNYVDFKKFIKRLSIKMTDGSEE